MHRAPSISAAPEQEKPRLSYALTTEKIDKTEIVGTNLESWGLPRMRRCVVETAHLLSFYAITEEGKTWHAREDHSAGAKISAVDGNLANIAK